MHRLDIHLDDTQYRALKARAARRGITVAAELREIIDAALAATSESDPLWDVIGIGRGDGSAVAENHADYLDGCESSPPR
jgi:plasmid stability protein